MISSKTRLLPCLLEWGSHTEKRCEMSDVLICCLVTCLVSCSDSCRFTFCTFQRPPQSAAQPRPGMHNTVEELQLALKGGCPPGSQQEWMQLLKEQLSLSDLWWNVNAFDLPILKRWKQVQNQTVGGLHTSCQWAGLFKFRRTCSIETWFKIRCRCYFHINLTELKLHLSRRGRENSPAADRNSLFHHVVFVQVCSSSVDGEYRGSYF